MKNEKAVPNLIRAGGDRAVAAYLDFFGEGKPFEQIWLCSDKRQSCLQ
jgi:hypothetical protein